MRPASFLVPVAEARDDTELGVRREADAECSARAPQR